MIYLDNAASSWPKPAGVVEAMADAVSSYGANPGRGSHRMALQASRAIFNVRNKLSKVFNIKNPNDIVLTKNTTEALNMALFGFLKENDHVICTSVEHNSVRRPLEQLRILKNVEVTYLAHEQDGTLKYDLIQDAITSKTKLLVCTHGSNLLGTILDLEQISSIVRKSGIKWLVDAAQTAGVIPIDVQALQIDLIAFPGHKALLGPQGTGGLYVSPELALNPLLFGGTGNRSEEIMQPLNRPEGYESGTLNTPGFAGLAAGIDYVIKNTKEIQQNEQTNIQYLIDELKSVNGLRLLGPELGVERCGLISFVHEKIDSAELSFILDQHYQIAVRAGFHCAPMAHQLAGTIGTGAVRASVGWSTSKEDVEQMIRAMHEITKQF